MTMLSLVFIIFSLLSVVLVFGVGILIGVLVYKDAIKREMSNPILWALLVVFAPSFIGLIIYFIVRSSYPKQQFHTPNKMDTCSFCGCEIQSDYVVCPHCGTSLKQEV